MGSRGFVRSEATANRFPTLHLNICDMEAEKSMVFDTHEIGTLAALLSPARLGALTALTGSVETAIELHQQTLTVGCKLMNVIATVEIGIRNAMANNLAHHFAVGDWLQRPPVSFHWRTKEANKITTAVKQAKRAKYAKLTQNEKSALDHSAYPTGRPPNESHEMRAKKRQRLIMVTEGDVIAEITLVFWKRLFGSEYEHHLWRPTLKNIFPDRRVKRTEVAFYLEHIYQARNRLAHHEPVLHQRFVDTVNAIRFITERIGTYPPSPNAPLAKLIDKDLQAAEQAATALHERLQSFKIEGGA